MQKLCVTTGGFIPSESDHYTENVADVDIRTLLDELPQMIRSMDRTALVREIEDPKHPLNGWIVEAIYIHNLDDDDIDDMMEILMPD